MKRELHLSLLLSGIFLSMLLILVQQGFAQVSSSTNYRLESDSINFGGGRSTSTSYTQESTFGELGTGTSSSATYQLRAGYQQLQEVYLSISAPADVELSPDIGGITGGTSNGSTTFTVITDNPAGYSVSIEAASSPAMRSGSNSINDHQTLPSVNFLTPTASSSFGYSVFGADVVDDFKNDGAFCGSGSNIALECWRGLTVSPYTILQGLGANHPSGSDTTLHFQVGVESGAGVPTGLYTATTTLTALPL